MIHTNLEPGSIEIDIHSVKSDPLSDDLSRQLSQSEADQVKDEIVVPKLLGSCRLTMCLLGFFGFFHIIWLRFNFSIGLVCMTGTDMNDTSSPQYIEVITYSNYIKLLFNY